MVLGLKSDTAVILGKTVPLATISLGHYTLPIFRPLSRETVHEVLISNEQMDSDKLL